ncbi:hypothetical protein BGZ74_006749 [Mortierella antarctica]|nr:hypothetical protein BGZ74_006749 [Mortierella antarctica]
MTTYHSTITFTQKPRPGGKDEPEDLRQLRKVHGSSLATLKELFADWTEEDLLYAIQDAGGDLEVAILRISDGHATQWGEVKGKKKTPKPKAAPERSEFRTQRGGFADRGSRGRTDATRGGRGGSTRGAPRAQNGGDRHRKETEAAEWPATTTDSSTPTPASSGPSWAQITASSTSAPAPTESSDPWSAPITSTSTEEPSSTPATTSNDDADSWDAPTSSATTDSWDTPAAADDSWGPSTTTPARKINTATIPAGSKMSWAKIVKPAEPVPAPKPAPAPAPASAPVAAPAPVSIPEPVVKPEPVEEVVESIPEPIVEVEAPKIEEPVPEVVEQEEEKVEEPPKVKESIVEPVSAPAPVTPVGPPGLKSKATTQPRRLNQDAPVVMPGSTSSIQNVAVKFGSFSLNDDVEEESVPVPEPELEVAPPAPAPAPAPVALTPSQPSQPSEPAQPAQHAPTQPAPSTQPYRPTNTNTNANAPGLSPAATNASYVKQDANFLGQQHLHGMGHDAMNSHYGSYIPGANQLGSFGMGPMASLPNDYAALYGSDIQRGMYYDPTSYGQMPPTGISGYQSHDAKYTQDASATTASTSGATSTAATQAQQTLQQQQGYPNMGAMPYYPYYYMPNQFPNAYQQSGYGQPFVNKNMYPMYQQQQQQQQQQQHSTKPGTNAHSPYASYNSMDAQGHHQYSQGGYDSMTGSGLHGMGMGNDAYAKYGNGMNYLGNQPASSNGGAKNNGNGTNYSGSDKTSTGSQGTNASQMAGNPTSLQGQQSGVGHNQGYYQQQMFSNYQQYPNQYHPNSGRNQQQFWSSQN